MTVDRRDSHGVIRNPREAQLPEKLSREAFGAESEETYCNCVDGSWCDSLA